MLDVVAFHLGKLPLLPITALLALRDVVLAPRGVSILMRIVLLHMRLRFHKNLRSLAWTQPAVDHFNAESSKLYCQSLPKPPSTVRAREIKLASPQWSATLAASKHPWKFFLIEPTRPFPSKRPFILYSHGGSFVKTFDPLHFQFLYEICERTGATILAHDYPRPPAGATHEETYAVLVELLDSLLKNPPSTSTSTSTSLSADETHLLHAAHARTKLVFAGDSAGGGISLSLCFELLQQNRDELLPDDAILISPAMDGRMTDAEKHDWKDPWLAIPPCHTVIAAWAGPNRGLDHYAVSPALAPEGLLAALLTRATRTRILNLQGTADVLLPGSLLFHDRLARVAASLPRDVGNKALRERVRLVKGVGMPHVWPLIPIPAPEVRESRRTIVAAINAD